MTSLNIFQKALPVWCVFPEDTDNQFVGFHTCINGKTGSFRMRIAARSVYRLFMNGKLHACGPARTAKGYCRVDEIPLNLCGNTDIAIEAAAYSLPTKYSNDCTMEPGLLAAEIVDESGEVISYTGDGHWSCGALTYRRNLVEPMSHCRGIAEYYDLTEDSCSWRTRGLSEKLELLSERVSFLPRRSPLPTLEKIHFRTLQGISDISCGKELPQDPAYLLPRLLAPQWFRRIPGENLYLEELLREEDRAFTGKIKTASKDSWVLTPNPVSKAAALLFSLPASEVGFLDFSVRADAPCVLDVVNSDHLNERGELLGNTYAVRFKLAPGSHHLTGFEPKLVRYAKFIFRTEGNVELQSPGLLDYTYPDDEAAFFTCSDGDLNRIYEAARRTLRLNTLDIFMDCPERERGGWLCDSYFSARGAWQMFGDLSVERDFLENFMLTDPEYYQHGFFPEVYPGVRGTNGDPGIMNWSFWLMSELCDYYARSGDRDFIESCRIRTERFVEGLLSFRGESGLLQDMGTLFVDWSLSNTDAAVKPISIPVNCHAVSILEDLSALYQREDWTKAAQEMRKILNLLMKQTFMQGRGDRAELIGDSLRRGSLRTEAGTALELFGGFHVEDRAYIREFINSMGSCPLERPDPNIGKSNLFIGLMVRFEVLNRLGRADVLLRELRDIYLEELRIGSGTLFESIQGKFGCHGFNGYAGALLTNMILGLGQPKERTKSVRISPHPQGLLWASGAAKTGDGMIFLRWAADPEIHEIDLQLSLPVGWTAEYDWPFELSGWRIRVNGNCIE